MKTLERPAPRRAPPRSELTLAPEPPPVESAWCWQQFYFRLFEICERIEAQRAQLATEEAAHD